MVRRLLAVVAMLLVATPLQAQDDRSPDRALARLLAEARAAGDAGGCTRPDADRLVRVYCAGHIRIGVREFYPLFATRDGGVRDGYEIDVADAIAQRLGVTPEFSRVNAATRIPLLAEDRVDMVIATMGHNTQRDSQVRFIRPHYYESETTVVGPRALKIAGWADIANHTVCATVGNGSNADLVDHDVRLMLFDEAGVLPARLEDETCLLAAQDDSFFAEAFTHPDFAGRFDQKFGFAQVPWGMAVAKSGSDRLARALDLMSQIFHRDGVFLGIARKHRIGTAYLEREQTVWQQPACNNDAGSGNPACVRPALDTELPPTPFVGAVDAFEARFRAFTGIDLALPMLRTAPAWSLLRSGIVNTLILIAGALISTAAFALLLGGALGSRSATLHWLARALTVTLQSSPIVLTLVVASTFAHALFPYSDAVSLGASIVALGMANGSNAGQAISEAMASLRVEGRGEAGLFRRALGRSATQLIAFLVNAAKGTPIASFIGAPELLSALTDITSFSSGRVTTYWLLLIFYTAVIMIVVVLCRRLQAVLEQGTAA
ncbi:MAG TPA: transporter substrate-binding domain-containing protein [Reyranella sp.]|nr:transporter substrate-binding domain-containing protein [Reyranella sp.]